MTETTIPVYRMNPATDRIIFGDELAEGTWVLCEDPCFRQPHGDDEDSRMRRQRFRRVTRLQRLPAETNWPPRVQFVGEWVDGYQEVHRYAVSYAWLVKLTAAELEKRAKDEPGEGTGPLP